MASEHEHQWGWQDDGMGFIGRCSLCGDARFATLEEVIAWYEEAMQQLAESKRRQTKLQKTLENSL